MNSIVMSELTELKSAAEIKEKIIELSNKISQYNSETIPLHELNVLNENIKRLKRIAELLSVEKFKLVFIGSPGDGKTTAICHYLNLLPDDLVGTTEKKMTLLATNSGRTTAAEVHILCSETTHINIEPLEKRKQEIYIRDYCLRCWSKAFSDNENEEIFQENNANSDADNSTEIDRIIRNMSELPSSEEDLIQRLTQEYSKDDFIQFYTDVLNKIDIDGRNVQSLTYDGNQNCKLWLQEVFNKINNGKMDGVSIPHRIFIHLSLNDIQICMPDFISEVIDTRGYDKGTSENKNGVFRSDLNDFIFSDDTISIIIDRIEHPISSHLQSIFKDWIIKENTDVIPRVSVMISCRDGELEKVCEADTAEDGERIKFEELKSSVASNKLNFNCDNTIFYSPRDGIVITPQPIVTKSGKMSTTKKITEVYEEIVAANRSFLTQFLLGVKNCYYEKLQNEATDIYECCLKILDSFNTHSPLFNQEKNAIICKLIELEKKLLDYLSSSKEIITLCDNYFMFIRKSVHWATIRKTTNDYGNWYKCNIFEMVKNIGWGNVSNIMLPYKRIINRLWKVTDLQLQEYVKSYSMSEKSAYLNLREQVETHCYNVIKQAFGDDLSPFWEQAQSISGNGYADRVIECYKNHINQNRFDIELPKQILSSIEGYFDFLIDLISSEKNIDEIM